MYEIIRDLVAIIFNPITLVIALIILRAYRDKEHRKSELWSRHEGRGA